MLAHPDAAAYTALGTWFGEHQQFECSTQAFQSALKIEPGSAKLNYFLGLSLYSSGQVEASIAPLGQSIQLDAKAILPRLLMAAVLHQLGRRSEAEAQWRAALLLDPASTEALEGLSDSLIDSGNTTAAIELLKPAVGNGGRNKEDLALHLARAYGVVGELNSAASTLQEALAANPASFTLTNAMTTVMIQQHRFQEAVALMQKYADQHPDETVAQIALLSALVLNDDITDARPLGRKLLTAAPHDFEVLYLNGLMEREAGEYAPARDHLQEAVKLQPENYNARFNLGAALAHLDDAADAKEQLEKAIALDSSQPKAHFQLAAVLRSLGQTQAAQEQLAIYKQLSTENTTRSQSDNRAELAAQKLAAGDVKQAVALYKEAADATPNDAMLQYKLSVALDQSGDSAGERAALEQVIKIDPTFALAQNQLGYLYSLSGETSDAEKHFRAAVTSAPSFTDAWINLAATLAQEGHMPEAQQAAATALQLDPNNAQAQQLNQKLKEATHP